MEQPPARFGTKSAGNLKAAQWHILWTLYIPLALLSLWTAGLPTASGDTAEMAPVLDNAMALTSLILLAYKRKMTRARAKTYREHVRNYVIGLQQLFPGFLVPYHHALFHIFDFLLLFGPIRSWWCFPFERLIGNLQQIPHNHKPGDTILDSNRLNTANMLIGELETTMSVSWNQGNKFRQWAARPDCPPAVKECNKLLDEVYATPTDTTLDDFSISDTKQDLYELTGLEKIPLASRGIWKAGVHFTPDHFHLGNSLVILGPDSSDDQVDQCRYPAKISYIYVRDGQIQLAIRRLRLRRGTLSDALRTRFPDFPLFLGTSTFEECLEEASLKCLKAHCAWWKLPSDYSLALDLDKVREPQLRSEFTV